MSRLLTGLLTVSLAVVGAACGGDDSASEPEPPALTKEEFVDRANDICVEGDAALEDVEEPQSLEEAADIVRDRLIPSLRQQISDIRDLGFPEADREQLEDTFDQAEEALDEVEADVEGAIEAQEDPFDEVNEELSDYGLDRCAG